jgi:hypothetical protein
VVSMGTHDTVYNLFIMFSVNEISRSLALFKWCPVFLFDNNYQLFKTNSKLHITNYHSVKRA